ncbi:hypothetical protein LJC08_03850 [Methanimicrococcus sp. OttesenSCG-928-J09]|nr:hypothetical protein [Methanimicrococcus sp. OttesenSCG-928-J09]
MLPIGVRLPFCSGRAMFKKIASRFLVAAAAFTVHRIILCYQQSAACRARKQLKFSKIDKMNLRF